MFTPPYVQHDLPALIEHAHAEEIPLPVWTPESLEALASTTAAKYGLNRHRFVETLRCESAGFTFVEGQSGVPDSTGPNNREDSWGVAQFHMPSTLKDASGEVMSKEEAQDPAQAIDAAGFNFSIGNASSWTCFRNLPR